jgi:NAD(P)H-dependent FMN reductase
MHTTIISGSHRKDSQSTRVGHYLAEQLKTKGQTTSLIDLGNTELPFWDEGLWAEERPESWKKALEPVNKELAKADSIVIIAPEYSGMTPARLKNFFLVVDSSHLAYKPALIVGVSAGRGGAYPVAELRMSSYKNTKLHYIPDHLIIRDVGKVLHNDTETLDERSDTYIRDRIDWTLDMLLLHSKTNPVRESDLRNNEKYAYGM